MTAAGVLWTMCGSFILFTPLLALLLQWCALGLPGAPELTVDLCAFLMTLSLSIVFTTMGAGCIWGTARGVRKFSILSIVLGGMPLGFVLCATMGDGPPVVAMALGIIPFGLLVAAGWLALCGRSRYRAWQEAQQTRRWLPRTIPSCGAA